MTRFATFLTLMVGGMEAVQPAVAAGVLSAGLTARMRLGLVGVYPFQSRQTPTCDSRCTPIIGTVASNNCTPSECCSESFENEYFNCFVCVASVVDLTDYTEPQSNIDLLYDECANLGLRIPVLTFPGQNPNRTLSSVEPPPSQTTVATITFAPLPPFFPTTTVKPTVPTASSTNSTQAPPPMSSLSSGIRSAETSCFNLIASAIMVLLCSAVRIGTLMPMK